MEPKKTDKQDGALAELIKAAEVKLTDAQAALADAKAEFDGATAPEDKTVAQGKINQASADVDRYTAALANLAKPASEAPKKGGPRKNGPKQEFRALMSIDHDGEKYAEGDPIEVDRAAYEQLAAVKAIAGSWQD